MTATSNNWMVSNDDLMADKEFAESATDFQPYEHDSFYGQVAQVADRIYGLHVDRKVRGRFIFSFECDYEGDLQGASVAVVCIGDRSMYLQRYLDLKRLTADREATGWNQATAIRDTLMSAYVAVRQLAVEKGLI